MPQRRPLLACLLLLAFVVGSVVGPVFHRVDHAEAQERKQSNAACHASEVHNADTAVWTGATKDGIVPECVLCTTRLLVLPPAPVRPASPRVAGAEGRRPGPDRIATLAVSHQFIRGPPGASEARLA